MRQAMLALAAAVSLTTLAGCAGDDSGTIGAPASTPSESPSPDDSASGPLSQAELDRALLTTANLSDEFEVDPDDSEDDGDEPDLGCLFAFEDVEDDDDEGGEIAFAAKDDPGLPGVFHFLTVTPSEELAEQGLDEITDTLDDCERVDTTDDDGTHWQLDVSLDRANWSAHSDAQVNLSAVGTLGMNALELPLTIELTVVRVDNAVSITAFFDITDDVGSAHRDLTDAAAARLEAVLAGEEPPTPEPVLAGYPIGAALGDLTESPDIEA